MPIRRGAKGTDLGGQFVGPKSIARALIKMMTPHEAETHDVGVKARTPKGGPAIGRLMARPSKASARMTPATRDAIAADHKASFGASPAPRGDMLAAARAHVADMQTKAAHQGSTKSLTVAEFDDLDSLDIGQQHAYEDFRTQGMGHEEALRRAQQGPSKAAPRKAGGTPPRAEPLSHDPAVREVQIDNRIRQAYTAVLSRSSNSDNRWVGLADLRNELGEGVNRHEVDDALRKMIHTDGVNVVPESNQKTLTTADRESAVVIGDQNKHLLTIADPSPRPLPSATSDAGAPSALHLDTGGRISREEAARIMYGSEGAAAKLAKAAPAKKSAAKAAPLTDRQKLAAQRAAIKAHRAENANGRAAANETMVGGDLGSIDALARAVSRGSQRRQDDPSPPSTPTKPTAAAKMAKAKAAKPPVTPDMLRNAQSPDDIAPLLEGRTAADLRQIASDAGIHVGAKATKDQLKQTILQHGVQRRLNSHAVTGPGVPTVAAPSAPTRYESRKTASGWGVYAISGDGSASLVEPAANEGAANNRAGNMEAALHRGGGAPSASPTPVKKTTAAKKMATAKASAAPLSFTGPPTTDAQRAELAAYQRGDNARTAQNSPGFSAFATSTGRVEGAGTGRTAPSVPTPISPAEAERRRKILAQPRSAPTAMRPEGGIGVFSEDPAIRARAAAAHDQITALATDLHPTPAKKVTAAQKMTRGKAAGVDPAETVAKLSAATSREEARSILAGMTVAQLKAISPSTAGLKKADLIDAIIERTVGNRLNSAAIRQL